MTPMVELVLLSLSLLCMGAAGVLWAFGEWGTR